MLLSSLAWCVAGILTFQFQQQSLTGGGDDLNGSGGGVATVEKSRESGSTFGSITDGQCFAPATVVATACVIVGVGAVSAAIFVPLTSSLLLLLTPLLVAFFGLQRHDTNHPATSHSRTRIWVSGPGQNWPNKQQLQPFAVAARGPPANQPNAVIAIAIRETKYGIYLPRP